MAEDGGLGPDDAVLVWLARLQQYAGPWWRFGVRYLSTHTGVPALVVGAVLVVVGWRILKKGARLAVEVALVCGVLLVLTELGLIRW